MPKPSLVKCPRCGIERGVDWVGSHIRADHPPVEQNGVHCLDCDVTYDGEIECPEEPEDHAVEAVFITETPLGLSTDQDFYHHGNLRYEYSGLDETGIDIVKEKGR